MASEQPLPLTELHYQLTDATVSIENLVANPALFHNFTLLSPKPATIRTTEQQALWLLVKVRNPYPFSWQAVLSYHFLPADRVSFYKVAKDQPKAELLSHTGSDFSFTQRQLPLHSFSQPIQLDAEEQALFIVRLQDAALLGTELTLASLPQLLVASQRQLFYDSAVKGALFVLIFLTFLRGLQLKQRALLALAGFYAAFGVVLGTLNGMAFSLLWPDNPEFNPVMLYISVGLALVFITLFNRYSLPASSRAYALHLNSICLLPALALLFSPLYATGSVKLQLLFICVTLILAVTVLQALYISLTNSAHASSRFSLLAAAATLNLLLVQTRYLSNFAQWLNVGIFLLLAISATLLFSLSKHSASATEQH